MPRTAINSYKAQHPWYNFGKIVAIGDIGPVEIDGICFTLFSDLNTAEVTKKLSGKYSGDIKIPQEVNYEGSEYSVTSIGENAFSDCVSLTSITISNSVTTIGESAFDGCSYLTTITIGNSVLWIEKYSLANCPELTDVTCLAENVPSTNSNAFDGSYIKYAKLHVPYGSIESYKSTPPWKDFGNIVELPKTKFILSYLVDGEIYKEYVLEAGEQITSEPEPTKEGYTFSGWSEIPETMPDYDVVVTGSFIRNFVVGDVFTTDGITYKVTSIEPYEVQVGDGIEDEQHGAIDKNTTGAIEIPSSVKGSDGNDYKVISIGNYAFAECRQLTSLTIPNSITSIGMGAFIHCLGLTSIIIPDGVTSIREATFVGCFNLTSIIIPNGVVSIETAAFGGCQSLLSMIIPSGVTSIGNLAFSDCISLQKIEVQAIVPPQITNTTFSDYSIPLIVPTGSVEAYNNADYWKNFTHISDGNKYKLTYLVDDEVYVTREILSGDQITPEAEPTKDGYTFSGWSEIPETMPDHDVIVTGSFERYFDVGSVVSLIDLILYGNEGYDDLAFYDMNNDGVLNVGDLILVVRKVLESTQRSAATRSAVDIRIPDLTQFTAAQFVLNVPMNVSEKNIKLVKSVSQTHQMMCKQIEPGAYAVVIYSLSNSLFKSEEDGIIEVNTENTDELSIENVKLAKPNGETNKFETMPVVTAISGVEKEAAHGSVYNLKGQKQNRVDGLQKGVYIENGKKIVVR